MKRLVVLIGMLITAAPAFASTSDIQRVEARIEALGVPVLWSNGHKVCDEEGLLGMYLFQKKTIVMCQENLSKHRQPILKTLQHEAWHAVQFVCNDGDASISDNKIRSLITHQDRATIEKYYPPSQWRAEAEARALESLPTNAFLNGVNHYCR